ncbi:hypothetical protein EON65_38300 [archaeon]|nr:MAG: hypothetical protein EON65_38300 [archaeon]
MAICFILSICSLFFLVTCGERFGELSPQFNMGATLGSDHLVNQQLITKTGTTIVGLCCRDGVVLGADTRSTGGPLIVDKNKLKIHTISPRIFACAAGTSADCDHLCRKTRIALALQSIDFELCGDYQMLNSVPSAVNSLCESLWDRQAGSRKPSAVFIIGGVDSEGAKLYQIDSDGLPLRVAYGSLGSGSPDAVSVLETLCADKSRPSHSHLDIDTYVDISVQEGIEVVRKAVQAGILNDLGSGSHVDLCVIDATEVQMWRERLVSSWEQDKLLEHDALQAAMLSRRRALGLLENVPEDLSVLGRRVWSTSYVVSTVKAGKVLDEEVTRDPARTFVDVEEL